MQGNYYWVVTDANQGSAVVLTEITCGIHECGVEGNRTDVIHEVILENDETTPSGSVKLLSEIRQYQNS